MKTKIFYNSWVARLLINCSTIMLFGVVFTRKNEQNFTDVDRRHECVHVKQYWEMVILAVFVCLVYGFLLGWTWHFLWFVPLFYYIVYLVEWSISLIHNFFSTKKKDLGEANHKAYHNSMFEQEAYDYDDSEELYNMRKPFGFVMYFGKI